VNPGVFDILFTIFLELSALWARSFLGRWITTIVYFDRAGRQSIGYINPALPTLWNGRFRSPESGNSFGKVRKSLKSFFTRTGNFQSRILLSWFYFIILMPFGILVRLTSDPLAIKKATRESYWKLVLEKPDSLESARRQY
jgi:hypothetical protein